MDKYVIEIDIKVNESLVDVLRVENIIKQAIDEKIGLLEFRGNLESQGEIIVQKIK